MKSGMACSHIFITTLFLVLTLCKIANAEESLTLAVHPFLSHEEVKKKFTPIANYLSTQLGKSINVRVGSSYEEHIKYIGSNKVDIAYMGPVSYVNLLNRFGSKPILAKLEVNGHSWFQGNIITRKDSGIKTLDDLKNKRIAFGDINSTMSYIVPHYMLHQAGAFTDSSVKHEFLGSHPDIALAVLSGDFDAGAVKPAVFKRFETKGLKSIAMTPKISEHLFVTRSNLPASQIQALRKAMLNMKKSTEGLAALHAIKKSITDLVEARSSDYDNLRKIMSTSSHQY